MPTRKFIKPISHLPYWLYPLFMANFVFFLGLLGCSPKNALDIDISSIQYTPKVDRFEKDLFGLDSTFPHQEYKQLEKKYPDFYPLFISQVAGLGTYPDGYLGTLRSFLHNKDLRKLKADCDSVYPNLETFLPQLTLGIRHFLYYYPHHPIPHFLTFISGFNSAIVNSDSSLGIGLDMFLGSHYPIYRSVNFPQYLTQTLKAQYIPILALKGFVKQIFPEKKESPSVLDEMVYEGKIQYFLDALYPGYNDTYKISYTEKQMEWCSSHEREIWSTLLEGDRLFKGEKSDLETYFSEGPFTPGLNAESAPRLGVWMGWQIVRKYMNSDKKVTLQQLMVETDSQKILRESGYRP